MSQSVSISFGLLFLSTLLITSILYSTVASSDELISNAKQKENERWEEKLHTKITLESAHLSNNSQQISLYVKNEGDVSIYDLNRLDLFSNCTLAVPSSPFINDTWIPYRDFSSEILNSGFFWNYSFIEDNYYNPLIWDPLETLNITIFSPNSFSAGIYTYCIATPNAVVDYFAYNTTKT